MPKQPRLSAHGTPTPFVISIGNISATGDPASKTRKKRCETKPCESRTLLRAAGGMRSGGGRSIRFGGSVGSVAHPSRSDGWDRDDRTSKDHGTRFPRTGMAGGPSNGETLLLQGRFRWLIIVAPPFAFAKDGSHTATDLCGCPWACAHDSDWTPSAFVSSRAVVSAADASGMNLFLFAPAPGPPELHEGARDPVRRQGDAADRTADLARAS